MTTLDDYLEERAGLNEPADPVYNCQAECGECLACKAYEKNPCKFCGGEVTGIIANDKVYFPCKLCTKFN